MPTTCSDHPGGRRPGSRPTPLAPAWSLAAFLALALALLAPATARAAAPSPYLDDLTWTELRERIAGGATTAILPVGGTEQSGPHLALGKHNRRAGVLAGRIAQKLGDAIVAPVVAYVPEGTIEPPTGHMRFPGTLSIPEATFEALLEAGARSLVHAGFRTVVLLGDHGGYQKSLERVAARLNRDWGARPGGPQAVALLDYYRVTGTEFVDALKARGFGGDEIGTHAGLADTALMLAVDPALVRPGAYAEAAREGPREGVHGDPRRATAELGQIGIDRVIDRSVQRIREATRSH